MVDTGMFYRAELHVMGGTGEIVLPKPDFFLIEMLKTESAQPGAEGGFGADTYIPLPKPDEAIIEALITEAHRIEAKYSRYRADSELSRINQIARLGGEVEVDDETAALLDFAWAAYRKSDGLFDITTGVFREIWDFRNGSVPNSKQISELLKRVGMDKVVWEKPNLRFKKEGMELDFGGIGKEYAVDRCVDIGRELGLTDGLMSLAGDLRVFGKSCYSFSITDPSSPGQSLASVPLIEKALATSGTYERFIEIDGIRYSHVLSPLTGMPVRGLQSVSVQAPTTMVAGILSTIALLKGDDGKEWLAQQNAPHLWVDDEGRVGGSLKPTD